MVAQASFMNPKDSLRLAKNEDDMNHNDQPHTLTHTRTWFIEELPGGRRGGTAHLHSRVQTDDVL